MRSEVAGVVIMTVTELSAYAFRREDQNVLTKRYGFTKTTSGAGSNAEENVSEVELSPMRHGTALHNVYETDALVSSVPAVQREVPLELTVPLDDLSVSVQGFADIISLEDDIYTVEELKTVRYFESSLTPFSDPAHFAQTCIYAHLLAVSAGLASVRVKLTYLRRTDGARVSFTATLRRELLARMFEALLERAADFIRFTAERCTLFPQEISSMPFPYRTIREGQEEFIREAYRALTHHEPLLVSAPTGIGKTISVLYPAVKAVGNGRIDRIFYFTAKNVTGLAALDAARDLAVHAPHLFAVMLCAKEQLCPEKKRDPSLNLRFHCRFCDKIDTVVQADGTQASYRERELDALSALLRSGSTVFTPNDIRETAKHFCVCPYELSLDLSEYCTLIVCDYNYAIDDQIRLKRYFKDVKRSTEERYAFLFDEAHNLPDRARNTYSAVLTTDTVRELSGLCETFFHENAEYQATSAALCDAMRELSDMCVDNEYVRHGEDGEEITGGFFESGQLPQTLIRAVSDMSSLLLRIIRDGDDAAELVTEAQRKLSKLTFAARYFDERFRFFASRDGERVTAELLCLDPSGIIRSMTAAARSVIMFSATLSPLDYFLEVTGFTDAASLELESPYERDDLCLIAYDSISTRYADRQRTAAECAEVIAEAVSARCGNYLVYFPSYDYMKRVCRLFARYMPECTIVMQRPGMSYRERERFIGVFHERAALNDEYTVGFCVLGGMFSEGIDLRGERLIGSVIVGTGMPQLSAERNIMAAYYDEKTERGHDFAYTCPGMNKVLQAAGRVIRSEEDFGMVLLIDDRLGDPSLKRLFPRHWRHMRFTGDTESLRVMLDEFWEEHDRGRET